MNEAFKGRRRVAMPAAWPQVSAELARSAEPEIRRQSRFLAITFGDQRALAAARADVADGWVELEVRRALLAALLRVHDSGLAATLRGLLKEPGLRREALRGLATYDDPETAEQILALYPALEPAERRDALNTLAARPAWAAALLKAVGSKRVPAQDLPAEVIRQIRNLKVPALDEQLAQVWGTVRDTPADRAGLIARYRYTLRVSPSFVPDPRLGRAVFARVCQQCHTLFGTGGTVGPDLTGSNRADLDYILSNVLDPSALIGNDYQAQVIATTDGRVLTGIIRAEDSNAVTLATANEVIVVPAREIEARRTSAQSMMPDGLWDGLSEREIRALLAYLASPAQVDLPETAEPAERAGPQ
jgi:putative heme-binding domain-containing protein